VSEVAAVDDTTPVVAGFDSIGDWHDGANGRYAPKGWSSAKALAMRALRGAFARDVAKAARNYGSDSDEHPHHPVWLEAADDYLTRVGVHAGQAVQVRYLDDVYGEIDAVHPDGQTRPVKVKWERFADHLPSRGGFQERTIADDLDKGLPWSERSQTKDWIKAAFEHDLGDVTTRASVRSGGFRGSVATVDVEVWATDPHRKIGALWYELRPNGTGGVNAYIQTASITTQRKGIGTRVTQAIEDGLRSEGVAEVRLGAMTDHKISTGVRTLNGAYTWARAGFDWDNVTQPAVKAIGERMLALDPDSDIGRRLTGKIGNDFPTPGDVALDPVGKRVLLGEDGNGATTWNGVKRLNPSRRPPAAERVTTPTVTRNRTKADRGLGQGTAARIKAAGGTGQATVADGYLARHGHPKGSTVTVTYRDDTYADVHPAEPGGKTIRSKWSHFADDAPEVVRQPVDPALLDEARQAWREYNSADLTGQAARIVGLSRESGWTPDADQHGLGAMAQALLDEIDSSPPSPVPLYSGHGHSGREFTPGDVVTIPLMATSTDQGMAEQFRFDATENWEGNDGITYHIAGAPATTIGTTDGYLGTERLVSGRFEVTAVRPGDEGGTAVELRYVGPATPDDVEIPEPGQPEAPGVFDRSRRSDSVILDALAKPGLVLPMGEATDLHSAKLTWLHEEGIRRGMSPEEARLAVLAIDTALDQSTDTFVWSRSPLDEAVAEVDAGRVDSDLARGVVLQRAFTDGVWQVRYGDAPTIPVSRFEVHDDPSHRAVPEELDGATSWVVRENEQQVRDWFALRDLAPEVVRWDVPRERALLLPWGEGRMRSDYVRIKGEVLVAGVPPKGRPPRDVLLDPEADPVDVARAIYGDLPGVETRNPMVREIVSGPPHATVTRRTVTVRGERPAVDGGTPDLFAHEITVGVGTDGDPFVSIFDLGGDPGAFDLIHTVADRVEADRIRAYTPDLGYGDDVYTHPKRVRQFIEEGWQFAPTTDPASIRGAGRDAIALGRPAAADDPVLQAWRDWDGRDVADIPPPQALLEPAHRDIAADTMHWLNFLGEINRTGRHDVPELPRPGGYIDWAQIGDLPDGTVVEWDSKSGPAQATVGGTAARELGKRWVEPDLADLDPGYGGHYPAQAKVVRYAAAPLPTVPDLPEPYPGVNVARPPVPAMPLVYPGKIVKSSEVTRLPSGTRIRELNDLDTPLDGDASFDWVVQANGVIRPDYTDRPSAQVKVSLDTMARHQKRYMVTKVPDTPGAVDMPADQQVRLRNALVDNARNQKRKLGDVTPIAVGAIAPSDWNGTGRMGTGSIPEVAAARRVLEQGRDEWAAERFPGDENTGPSSMHGVEPVGPVWRIPGTGVTNGAVYTDTPIDGATPEVLTAGNVEGALRDDQGWMLFAPGYHLVPWRDPQPSPLTDDQVDGLIAGFADPTQPPGPLNVARESFRVRADGVPPTGADIAEWIDQSAPRKLIRRADIPGQRSVTGPIQAVRIHYDPDDTVSAPAGMRVEWFPYPIGSPEMDAAGWDPEHELVLGIDDPRLPAALDAAWWRHEVETGKVATAIGMLSNGATPTPPQVDNTITRALVDRSAALRRDATRSDGTIPLSARNGRFVVDHGDDAVSVPADQVLFLHDGPDGPVAAVTGAAAREVTYSLPPNYGAVYDADRSWEERVDALAAQRDKLLAGMPGHSLDVMFSEVDDKLEDRILNDPEKVTAGDREQLTRADAIEEYGHAVQALVTTRISQIESDPARRAEYVGGDRVIPKLTPPQAKSLGKMLDSLPIVDGAQALDDQWGDNMATEAVAAIRSLVDDGDVYVKLDTDTTMPGTPFLANAVTISTRQVGLVDRARGGWVKLWFGVSGQLARVEVRHQVGPDGAAPGRYWNNDVPADKPVGKRMMKLAKDLGLVSNADPRPTLAELAFLDTLEQMGIDTGTDGEVRAGKANPRNLWEPTGSSSLARGSTPEVYAAKIGLNPYPKDWTSTIVGRPQGLTFGTDDEDIRGGGFNTDGGRNIHIADPRLYPQYRSTVVHEFGHTMQRTVPGLTQAEQWYLARRIQRGENPGSVPQKHGQVRGRDVWTWDDGFARSYTGRLYNGKTIADNGSSYEVFTTAMETLLAEPGRTDRDPDLAAWVAGLLTLIRPTAAKEG
jgi:hypothetical protein